MRSCRAFFRGWLRDEPIELCCSYANAGGAFAVSRLLCSAEYATFSEMQHFIENGSETRAVRLDPTLNHIHWSTTRDAISSYTKVNRIFALAIDHRAQLEKIADDAGSPRERIKHFKILALDAALKVGNGQKGFGMLLDGTYGRDALSRLQTMISGSADPLKRQALVRSILRVAVLWLLN